MSVPQVMKGQRIVMTCNFSGGSVWRGHVSSTCLIFFDGARLECIWLYGRLDI